MLDRCGIAEPIYGHVYRRGLNRIELWQKKILEHVAMECRGVVIWCMPPLEACLKAFNSRRDQEMLDDEGQLREVYERYRLAPIGGAWRGSSVVWDYTRPGDFNLRSLL